MRFLQYVCQKSLLRHYGNTKVQKNIQLPPFAVLNFPKRMNKLLVTMDFDLFAHLNGEDNFLDYKATKEIVVSILYTDYFDTTPLLLQFII